MNTDLFEKYAENCKISDAVDKQAFLQFGVKRGLRDIDGNGVLCGLTNISTVEWCKTENGVKKPCDGRLFYRGYNIKDIISQMEPSHLGFEEIAYLLILGDLPNKSELCEFKKLLASERKLPTNFTRDVIMKAPSKDIMNMITRCVLTLASYDVNVSDNSIQNVLNQCFKLISVLPMISVYAYHAYNHYKKDASMYIHRPDANLSIAENLLLMLRPDKKYTPLEAKVLDTALILHMEHGGGNNSTFTTRVVTSAGSDTYSVTAAALSSLKGPKHGGANIKVVKMMKDLKKNVRDVKDEDEIRFYLEKIVDKQGFDNSGLIYGMGHAVYSLSDPRAEIFKSFVEKLAKSKGRYDDLMLYSNVEKLAKDVINSKRKIYKGICTNVDFYSGFVYSMLDIPKELYTPIFAIARMVGWSAHRIEELINMDKIMRPAYMSISKEREYKKLEQR